MNNHQPKWFAISHITRRIIASGATYRARPDAALVASGWAQEADSVAPYAIVSAAWFGQTQEGAQR